MTRLWVRNAISCPDSFGAVDAGAVPAMAALDAADLAFAPSSPFDGPAEACQCSSARRALDSLSLRGMTTLLTQRLVSCRSTLDVTVAAVGGDYAWRHLASFFTRSTAGANCAKSGGLLCSTEGSSTISSTLSTTLALCPTRPAACAGRWRSGGRPHRAGSPRGRPIEGVSPHDALPSLCHDLPRCGQQFLRVVHRAGRSPTPTPDNRVRTPRRRRHRQKASRLSPR